MATTGGGYKLAVISATLWSHIVQHLVHQDRDLKFYSLLGCNSGAVIKPVWFVCTFECRWLVMMQCFVLPVGYCRLRVGIQLSLPLLPLRVPALTGWGEGGNVTSAGWQVILCDPIWHVSSRSGEACGELPYPVTLLTLLLLPKSSASLRNDEASACMISVTGVSEYPSVFRGCLKADKKGIQPVCFQCKWGKKPKEPSIPGSPGKWPWKWTWLEHAVFLLHVSDIAKHTEYRFCNYLHFGVLQILSLL